MSKTFLFATVFWLIPFAGDVRADEPATDKPAATADDPAAMFKQLDGNADGKLQADEVPAERKRLFDRLLREADKNDDGALDATEFAAGLSGADDEPQRPAGARDRRRGPEGRPNPARLFDRLDANSDGKVVADEVPAERREMFERLVERGDKDDDQALSREEFVQALPSGPPDGPPREGQPPRPDQPPAGGDGPPRKPDGQPVGPPEGRPDGRRFFERLDVNGDDKVTADEQPEQVRPRIEKLIERADKDGDKAVTMDEFRALPRPEGRPGRPEGRPGRPGDNPPGESEKGRPDGVEGRPGGDRPDGRPAAGRPNRRPRPDIRRGPPPLFGALDADGDGKLSSDEISAAAEALRKLDKDGDGTVLIEEIGPPPPSDRPEND
ncbi:MAG: hypothetical protein AB7O59_05205 [Pirellulales bacterium]